MKISQRTLKRLGTFVTGDNQLAPYRSGPKLVDLFNEFGFDEVYPSGGGFPSRWFFAEEKLQKLNGSDKLQQLVMENFDSLEFEGTPFSISAALEDFNKYLERDEFKISLKGNKAAITKIGKTNEATQIVNFVAPDDLSHNSIEFVQEHIRKCEAKLSQGDYRGAITNARSICEEVLFDIEKRLDASVTKYNGDLPRLYKRVARLLKLSPEDYKEQEDVLKLLSGLVTTIEGLSGMSNAMSDRHGGSSKSSKPHHAILAVNSANTLCTFVTASFTHQAKQQ